MGVEHVAASLVLVLCGQLSIACQSQAGLGVVKHCCAATLEKRLGIQCCTKSMTVCQE